MLLAGCLFKNRRNTNLFLAEVIGKVGYHDLGGRWDAVLWWASLFGWARSAGFGVSGRSSLFVGLGGDISQGERVFSKISAGSDSAILNDELV